MNDVSSSGRDPQLSVVIPCYNAAATLARQLEAMARQTWPGTWELVFVDNGSTDDSRAIAERFLETIPNMRIIEAKEGQGTSYAVNRGVEAARGRLILLADADDQVDEGWMAAMAEALKTTELAAPRFDVEALNEPWVTKFWVHPQSRGIMEFRNPPYLPHAGGSGLGFTKELFVRVGGYDPSLVYLHDTDFCWKAQRSGAKLAFVPDAVMHISYRSSVRAAFRQARNYGEYQALLYKRYRRLDMPPADLRSGFRDWVNLFSAIRSIRRRPGRILFAARLGRLWGRFWGGVKQGVLVL